MSLVALLAILRSRRWLVLGMGAAAVLAAAAVFLAVPLSYTATASMVVLSPTRPVTPGVAMSEDDRPTANPYLLFGGSQATAAQVLNVRMTDDGVADEVARRGVSGDWKVEFQGATGPLLVVEATEATPAHAVASAAAVVDVATEQFAALQLDAGSPEEQVLQMAVVTVPADPSTEYQAKLRATVLVLGMGFGATVALPLALEGIARRRPAKSTGSDPDGAHDDPHPDRAHPDAGGASRHPGGGGEPCARGTRGDGQPVLVGTRPEEP
jgi:hypothetical protein